MSYWRDKSLEIIREVLEECKDADEATKRRRLREAYPFGERSMHPYKIWCDEVNRALGKKSGKRWEAKKNESNPLFEND